MDRTSLLKKLNYPAIWEGKGLLTEELLSFQVNDFIKEYGSKTPENGTEHYRYGAFCYYVKNSDTKDSVLTNLIEAAAKDPDAGMAQCAIIDLVSHQNCTNSIYIRKQGVSQLDY